MAILQAAGHARGLHIPAVPLHPHLPSPRRCSPPHSVCGTCGIAHHSLHQPLDWVSLLHCVQMNSHPPSSHKARPHCDWMSEALGSLVIKWRSSRSHLVCCLTLDYNLLSPHPNHTNPDEHRLPQWTGCRSCCSGTSTTAPPPSSAAAPVGAMSTACTWTSTCGTCRTPTSACAPCCHSSVSTAVLSDYCPSCCSQPRDL